MTLQHRIANHAKSESISQAAFELAFGQVETRTEGPETAEIDDVDRMKSAQKIEPEIKRSDYRLTRSSRQTKSAPEQPVTPRRASLQQLTTKANVGDILSATLLRSARPSGEAAELQKHYGLGSLTKYLLNCCGLTGGVESTGRGHGPGEHRRRLTSRGDYAGVQLPVPARFWASSGPTSASW